MISKDQLVKIIQEGDIQKGDILNLKVSLKSIGKIENGPNALIDAFLEVIGTEGTIISDAFVDAQFKTSKKDKRVIVDDESPTYAGAVASAMIKHKGSYRSQHPIQKFVAIGKMAKELTQEHTKDSFAYDVLRKMVDLHGKNIIIGPEEKVPGVGTTHVVICEKEFEQRRIPKGVYFKNENDKILFHQINWVGGCSFGFSNLMDIFIEKGAVLSNTDFGNTTMKVTSMKKTYEIEHEYLSKNPQYILCNDPSCISCRLSWSFSDTSYSQFFFQHLLKGKFRKALGALYYKFKGENLKGQKNIQFKNRYTNI